MQVECEFLVCEYGFEELASPLEHNSYSVRFRKGEFEVDVYGENYGLNASCDLVRGEERLSLGLLVPVEERERQKWKGVRPGQLAQVHGIATRLKRYASDFLRGDSSRFDSAFGEWRRVTQPRQLTEAERVERQRQQAVAEAGHASKRADYAEVVRLLHPHADALSRHQRDARSGPGQVEEQGGLTSGSEARLKGWHMLDGAILEAIHCQSSGPSARADTSARCSS